MLVINMTNKIAPEYNYYLVMAIWKLNLFLGISLVVQCSTFSVIRYLFVFHFAFITSKSERKIKIITRTCVVTLASLCIIIDEFTKSREFFILTNRHFKEKDTTPKNNYLSFISSIVITCISILVIVLVQARIIHEKRKIPTPPNMYKWDFFNLKQVSLALFIFVAFALLMISKSVVNIFAVPLQSSTLRGCIIGLVIILTLIKSNNRMYKYVMRKITPDFILKDMEMWRRIHSNPAPERHQISVRELNAFNNFPNPQSNRVLPPNPIIIHKSIDQSGGRNSSIQINMNPTSNVLPSRNTLPDVSI